MPYTPPSTHSPTSSRSETPSISRSNSYSKGQGHVKNVGNMRPDLPRSASATYLHKSRRSPTATKPDIPVNPSLTDGSPCHTKVSDQKHEPVTSHFDGSVRASADLVDSITTRKAEIQSAEHSPISSDEDVNAQRGRRRELDNLAELQEAIRIIEQHRESSPNRTIEATKKAKMVLGLIVPSQASPHPTSSGGPTHPLFSNGARKTSHSRSATEPSAILDYVRNYDSPARSTSESEVEEDYEKTLRRKPAMVRKKSGELVRPALRPASARRRPSSMPGTPTYSKAVHFNQDLEQVRHFLQVDRPLAVSAGSSPVESYESEIEFPFSDEFTSRMPPYEWEIRLSNFPRETIDRMSAPVKVERVYLTPDTKTLMGAVAVANIAFHKLVVARFTLDYWKTTSEIVADFNNDVRRKQTNDGYDRFNFSIKLDDQANLESKTMFICIRYSVNGQEFWDNNNGFNYQVDFSKKAKAQRGKQSMQGAASRPLPRSKPSPPAPTVRNMPSFDDFAKYDVDSFRQPAASFLGDAPIRLKNPRQPENFSANSPALRTKAPAQVFGNRYDFGASLSAAMQAANDKLGDRSGLPPAKQVPAKKPSFAKQEFVGSRTSTRPLGIETAKGASSQKASNDTAATKTADIANVKPAALTAEKPSLQSTSYHELIDRYCFFGSAKVSPQIGKAAGRVHTDGAFDDSPESDYGFDKASRSRSPSPPIRDSPPPQERKIAPQSISQRDSRSASPATSLMARAASPDIYGYPYHQTLQNGFLNESLAPTAILG